jgi:hypothetical protein
MLSKDLQVGDGATADGVDVEYVPFTVFGAASVYCFMRSYRYLRPEVESQAHRLALRGPLMRQNLMAALIAAGLIDR